MINKNRFCISNDKKVLHKIGKRWVTVSALTLALLGGGALAGSVTTHADTTPAATQSVAAKPSASAKATAPSSAQSQSTSSAKPSSANSLAGNIESQAGRVHKGLMLDATQHSGNDMNILTTGHTPEDKAKQAKTWNFVQNGVRNDDYDKTATKPKFNSAYEQYLKDNPQLAHAYSDNTDIQDNNKSNTPKHVLGSDTPLYAAGNGVDHGLNYKADTHGNVEFTGGVADSDLSSLFDPFNGGISPYTDISEVPNAIKSVTFDNDVDTSHVTNMSGMFGNLSNLQSINFGNSFDTSHVTNMSNMFQEDSSLKSLDLSHFNTSNVTDMSSMFDNDSSLQSIDLSNFNTSNVTDMSSMFGAMANSFRNLKFIKLSPNVKLQSNALPANLSDGVIEMTGTPQQRQTLASTLQKAKDASGLVYAYVQKETDVEPSASDQALVEMWNELADYLPYANVTPQQFIDDLKNGSDIKFSTQEISNIGSALSSIAEELPNDAKHFVSLEYANVRTPLGINSNNQVANLFDGNAHPGTWKLFTYDKNANNNINFVNQAGVKVGSYNIGGRHFVGDNATVGTNPDTDIPIPTNTHLANNQSSQEIMLGTTPATVNVISNDITDTVAFYTKHGNDNVLVSTASVKGADGSSVSISKDVPNDYRLANGNTNVTLTANPSNGDIQLVSKDNQPISSNSYILREVNPYFDDAIIQYQNGSQNVGAAITLPKQTFGKSVSVGSLNNVPAGYQLANSAQQIKYDGNTYNVPVKKLPEAAPYGVVYLNQNKVEVGQATLSNLGYVGQTVNVEPQLAANVPQGYHLDNTNPINVTLNDGGLINVNGLGSTGLGSSYHGLLGGMLKDSPNATDNHVISVSGNPVTYSGNVTLNFKADGQTVKTITKPYSVTTYTGDTVNLFKPSSYLDGSSLKDNNHNPITINATDFTPDGSNNPETVTVQPSDAPQTSGNTKTNDSYSLNYDANSVNDNVTYDLSGANVPAGYHGKTGSKGQTSLNGVYDTNVPLSALKTDAPTNYHIVSGSNIRYDGGSHTVEIAPDTEKVSVTYTDQNGHTYTSPVSGQYDQKYSNITKEDHVPAGYHVNAGQDNSYQFNSDQGQSKGLSITGDTQSGNVAVIIKKYDGSNYIGSETKTVHESGETGNGFTIDPSGSSGKSLVPAGYQANSSSYKGTFTPTGLSTDSVTFDYKAVTGTPIKVNYFNQHGANVGSGTITGNTDDTGSISSKVPVPDDYTVDANQPSTYHILSGRQSPIDINVTGKPASATINFINQDNGSAGSEPVTGEAGDTVSPSSYPKGYEVPAAPTKYTFTKSGQNPDEDNVRLVGDVAGGINGSSAKNAPKDAAHGYVTVHVVEKSTSGKVLHRFDVPVSENAKRVGDSYTVKPSDVKPSDYDVASGDSSVTGVIDNDGSVSNSSVTDTYTVHANDIEPISITIKNQNGHYIDLSDGKLTDSSDKATSTISSSDLAQLGGIGDKVDITGCITAPKGYHLNGNKEDLTDANGQPLNAIALAHKQSGLGAMPLMLAIWTPAPKKRPAQPSKPASASAKPSSSAAAQPSSASVVPSSKAPSASSSTSAAPSSSSTAPSSVSSSVAPSSTSSAAPQQVIPSDDVAPANRARIVPSDNTAKPAPHAKRNDSGIASGETKRNVAKRQNQPNLSKHNRRANRNEEKNVSAAPSDSTAASVSAANGTGYTAANVRPVSAAPVAAARHSSGKLPQTGDDAAATGLAGVLMLLSSIGLAGADLDRKHRLS